jgi:hypothetical protein
MVPDECRRTGGQSRLPTHILTPSRHLPAERRQARQHRKDFAAGWKEGFVKIMANIKNNGKEA